LQIYGNTSGLSPSAKKTLERIYRRRVPLDTLVTPELQRSLVEASIETGRQVGVLVHRSGQVDYVIAGDSAKLDLPDVGRLRASEGRLRGLRLIHTHVRGEPLTQDDLVDLVRLRLDLVCAIQLAPSGDVRALTYAHNAPGQPPYRIVGPLLPGRADLDVGRLVSDLEAEFGKRTRAHEVRAKDGRAILVFVTEKRETRGTQDAWHQQVRMHELRELARTAGVEVADSIVQVREKIDPRTVIGEGKLDEVIVRAAELDADVLVFDRNLSPSQASAIGKTSELKILDRSQLILDIFAQRAESRDGKLQVELAQLKYAMPRLQQKDDSLSRLSGGIGGRGPGETKLEIGKRRAKDRVVHLESQLKKLGKQREQRRRKRTREGVPTVAIVGYTNAGKSTLLNTLTGAHVLAEDKLFATLDTRSRVLKVGWAGYGDREVVITDTVGFIRDLPKDLFAAFRATFEEAADADLLLHVVDASDPAKDDHIATTVEVLEQLDLAAVPRVIVYNKVDLLGVADPLSLSGPVALERANPDAVLVTATKRETLVPLIERIATELAARWESAAKIPALPSTRDLEGADDEASRPADDGEITTLDAMLAAAGRSRRR
jgi:GTP-binding protein HflX